MSRREAFSRSERLRDGRVFRAAREKGLRVVGRYLILNALPAESRQFGVITARSFGPAVARNRARRWLREMFRRNKVQLQPNFSLVVVARQALARAPFAQAQAEFLALCERVGARRGSSSS